MRVALLHLCLSFEDIWEPIFPPAQVIAFISERALSLNSLPRSPTAQFLHHCSGCRAWGLCLRGGVLLPNDSGIETVEVSTSLDAGALSQMARETEHEKIAIDPGHQLDKDTPH